MSAICKWKKTNDGLELHGYTEYPMERIGYLPDLDFDRHQGPSFLRGIDDLVSEDPSHNLKKNDIKGFAATLNDGEEITFEEICDAMDIDDADRSCLVHNVRRHLSKRNLCMEIDRNRKLYTIGPMIPKKS